MHQAATFFAVNSFTLSFSFEIQTATLLIWKGSINSKISIRLKTWNN